jgi:hypothetical protein
MEGKLMSVIDSIDHGTIVLEPRASLEELKDFANQVREAGGANPLDSLMPAIPQNSNECLIALNLNFSCEVEGEDTNYSGAYDDLGYNNEEQVWCMRLEDYDTGKKIANKLGLNFEGEEKDEYSGGWAQIILPAKIGRVAAAFDAWKTLATDVNYHKQDYDVEDLREQYGVSEMAEFVKETEKDRLKELAVA